MVSRGSTLDPPRFVGLLAHPVRWRLLEELVQSDRAVRELTGLLDEPQNLVSYHLRLLRDGGLVTARRSSADARDSYYAIDLARCRHELQATGRALHPGLWLMPVPPVTAPSSARHQRVLFLCTGNSARSQMAEALIRQMSGGAIDAMSAGSNPKELHPNAVRVMGKYGIDISRSRAKHLDKFVGQRFDAVVTLCDRVREVCPEFPGHPQRVHWSIPDPALDGSTNRASYPAFVRTASELETRIGFLVQQLNARPTRRSKHAER
jgi:protein-tyrosine-phosphatase/DNA-binding transcriptional ArsR family regulator